MADEKPQTLQEEKKEKESKVEGVKEEKPSKAKSAKAKSESGDVEVPKKFKSLVEEIEKMSVLDLAELVKVLEDKFGVSAAAPAVMAPMAVGIASDTGTGAVEEKSEFTVELVNAGSNKIAVIKAVKEVTGFGLADAKALVDGAPKPIKEKVTKEEAEEIKKKIEEAGGKVELK